MAAAASAALSRRVTLLVACAALWGCAGSAKSTVDHASGEEFAFQVEVGGGRHGGGLWGGTIDASPSGETDVTFEYWIRDPVRRSSILKASRRIVLDSEDRAEIRRTIERSGFFEGWPEPPEVTCQDTWRVKVRVGDRSTSRVLYAQEEFREAERLLKRVIRQGVAEYAVAEGRFDLLEEICASGADVLHPETFVAALRERAVRGPTDDASAPAVGALGNLMPEAEFAALIRASLDRADSSRKEAILAVLVGARGSAAAERHRATVVPLALEELKRSWREWGRPPEDRAELLRGCAEVLVLAREADVLPIFERMVSELSTKDHPLVLEPLAGMGESAIDPLGRLLEHARVEVRIAAAWTCEGLVGSLCSPYACVRPRGVDPAAAMRAMRERVGPCLERAADDEDGDARFRRAAGDALAALGLRQAPPGWKPRRLDDFR